MSVIDKANEYIGHPREVDEGYEVKERIEIMIPEGYKYVIESDKIIFTKKKKEYPKTYEECCEVLFPNSIALGKVLTSGYNCELLAMLGKLLICRDAYWKLYGEEIGLGKSWEPDWKTQEEKYAITYICDELKLGTFLKTKKILAFPTPEMRDAFYDNFKELIEQCKELL